MDRVEKYIDALRMKLKRKQLLTEINKKKMVVAANSLNGLYYKKKKL